MNFRYDDQLLIKNLEPNQDILGFFSKKSLNGKKAYLKQLGEDGASLLNII